MNELEIDGAFSVLTEQALDATRFPPVFPGAFGKDGNAA